MRRLIFISLFFLNYGILLCQQEFIIKISPLNILDPVYSTLPVSLEIRNSNFGLEYEHGFQTPDLLFRWNNNRLNFSYYKNQLSFRYYLHEIKKINYLGLVSSFVSSLYNLENNWYKNDNKYYKYESSNVSRNYLSFAIFAGGLMGEINNIFLESNFGLGISTRIIRHQTVNEKLTEDSPLSNSSYYNPERVEGLSNHLYVMFNIKIGLKLITTETKKSQ